jgi:hypothetical protein
MVSKPARKPRMITIKPGWMRGASRHFRRTCSCPAVTAIACILAMALVGCSHSPDLKNKAPVVRVSDASGRFDAATMAAFEAYAVDAADRIVAYLGASATREIEVVLDPEQRVPYTEDPDARGMVVIRLPARRLKPADIAGSGLALEHELTHAIAPGSMREDRLLVEGLAVHVQDHVGPAAYPDFEMSPHEAVRALQAETGAVIPLGESEIARTRRESGDERRLAYAQEGAFVRWLIETRGLESFLAFYRSDAGYEEGLGAPLTELERQWRQALATY